MEARSGTPILIQQISNSNDYFCGVQSKLRNGFIVKVAQVFKETNMTVIPMNLPQTKTVSLNREIKESGI